MKLSKDRTVIASDVNKGDGIGVEIYRDDNLLLKYLETTLNWQEQLHYIKKKYHLNYFKNVLQLSKKKFLGTLLIMTS